jgi:hypothetical protein
MDRGQAIQTSMDIADGINALTRRQGRRGGGQIDHQDATKQNFARDATNPNIILEWPASERPALQDPV